MDVAPLAAAWRAPLAAATMRPHEGAPAPHGVPALEDAATLPAEPAGRRVLTRIAGWLDEAALRSLCFAFDRSLTTEPDDLGAVRASAAPYVAASLARDPRRFFAFLDAPATAAPLATARRRRLDGGAVDAHLFASPYDPWDPAYRDAALAAPENVRLPVEHWAHDGDRPRATVIALHGFTMGSPRIDAVVLRAASWYAAGLDVVLPTLPLHGARAPGWSRFSGELFGSWHVGRVNEAVRQAVADLHRVQHWIRRTREGPVGLFGLSLGGYVAALAAGLSADFDFVLPVVPAVCLASLPCRLHARSRYARRGPPPLDLGALRAGYRVHSPLRHARAVAKRRVLIVAGRGDRVVPPGHADALWRHWGEPAILWFSGSHFAPFRRAAIVAAGLAHLRALGLLA